MKLCENITDFVLYVLQATPSEQQMEVLEAIDEGEKAIAIRSGHGTGKTSLLSWIALWVGLSKYDAKIPLTAPSHPQLIATLVPEIKKWRDALPSVLQRDVVVKREEVHFANGNFAIARTARKENPEALQGFHAINLCFIVDEASGVEDGLFQVIEGALTGEHNIIILAGNPTRTSGYFFNVFHKHKNLWRLFVFNAEKSENVNKKVIEKRRIQYGRDSDIYGVRVLGEFPRASSDALFAVADLEEATNRTDADDSGVEKWGLDIARYGDDKSVLAKRKGYMFRPLQERRNFDSIQVADWVSYEYKTAVIKPVGIWVDTIGIGAGVFDILLSRNLPVFDGNVARKSFDEGLLNKRIEMYKRFSEALIHTYLPEDEELLGELSAIRYVIHDSGKMALEKKDDAKKRLGRSPDKADAVALTFYDEDVFIEDESKDWEYRDGWGEWRYSSGWGYR